MKLMQTIQPDLLILEPAVSRSDQFELVNHLKKLGLTKLPLVVYTSLDLSEAEKAKLSLGASRHLVKSISSLEDVIASVDSLLGINRSAEHQN